MEKNEIKVEVINEKSRKTGKEYEALKVTVGEWSKLIFINSSFEMAHIKKVISENE